MLMGAKKTEYVVSVLSDTPSAFVGQFLALAENFLPVYHIFVDHHTSTCRIKMYIILISQAVMNKVTFKRMD